MSTRLQPGAVYEQVDRQPDEPRFIRIVHVLPDDADVAIIRAPDEAALPEWMSAAEMRRRIDAGELVRALPDPLVQESGRSGLLTGAEERRRDKRWELIGELIQAPDLCVLAPERRGALVALVATRKGVAKKTIYRVLRLWWQGGMHKNALTPQFRNCGAPGVIRLSLPARVGANRKGTDDLRGGPAVTEEVVEMFKDGLPLVLSGMSFPKAWKKVKYLHFSDRSDENGLDVRWQKADCPSFRQFEYHLKKYMKPGDLAKGRLGEDYFERNLKAKIGRHRFLVQGPGAIYQIDATVMNVLLRSEHSILVLLGRPILYLVRDVYSGLIVGYLVTMLRPSKRALRLVLENAMTDKVAYCASLGIPIKEDDWPAQHRPAALTCDNGPEFASQFLIEIGKDLGINPSKVKAFSPQLKGLIEHGINLIQIDLIEHQEGAWKQRKRGEERCELDAKHTVRSMRKLVALWILQVNHRRTKAWPEGYVPVDDRDPSHLDLWFQGSAYFSAPELIAPDRVRHALLERGEGRTGQNGLRFNGRTYLPTDDGLRHMLNKVPGGKWRSLHVRWDPRRIGEIGVVLNGRLSSWTLQEDVPGMSDWSEEDYEEWRAKKRDGARKAELDDSRATARFHAMQTGLEAQVAHNMGRAKALVPAHGLREEQRRARLSESREGAPRPVVPAPPPPATIMAPRTSLVADYTDLVDETK